MQRLLALGSLCLLGACASSPDGAAQELAGCYYFEQDETARELNLPWGVQLTTDSLDSPFLEGQENVRAAITLADGERTADFPFGYWQPLTEETLRLGHPGMGGFTVDLTIDGDALSGRLAGEGDVATGAPMRSFPVRLTRARCPE